MYAMRTHFEQTWFDNEGVFRKDVGAGPGQSPIRWRPLVWKSGDNSYVNERTLAVQQTAWNFVAHMRPGPKLASSVIWWAPDDSSTALRVPFYGAARAASPGVCVYPTLFRH